MVEKMKDKVRGVFQNLSDITAMWVSDLKAALDIGAQEIRIKSNAATTLNYICKATMTLNTRLKWNTMLLRVK